MSFICLFAFRSEYSQEKNRLRNLYSSIILVILHFRNTMAKLSPSTSRIPMCRSHHYSSSTRCVSVDSIPLPPSIHPSPMTSPGKTRLNRTVYLILSLILSNGTVHHCQQTTAMAVSLHCPSSRLRRRTQVARHLTKRCYCQMQMYSLKSSP